MHELNLEQFKWAQRVGFRLFPNSTSASIPTDPQNKSVLLFYKMAVKKSQKGSSK